MNALSPAAERTTSTTGAPPNLLFARRFCASPAHGRGAVTFEDDEVGAKAHVILSITFEDGRTLTGGLVFFSGLGVRFIEGTLIDLPLERARLNGHHAPAGWAVSERAAVAVLRGQGRWAA